MSKIYHRFKLRNCEYFLAKKPYGLSGQQIKKVSHIFIYMYIDSPYSFFNLPSHVK